MNSPPQSLAIRGNGFGVSLRFWRGLILPLIAADCNRSAPQLLHHKEHESRRFLSDQASLGMHDRPCFAAGLHTLNAWNGPDTSRVGDVAEMKGYRVRLRVVEEYDVALLAASAADAKARAEAEVRSGGDFEAIQDTWPEETVSVEAVSVEPYADLE